MNTAVALVTIGTPIATGLAFLARGIWRMSGHAHQLTKGLDDNTKATQDLAGEFRENRADVGRQLSVLGQVLADHGERLGRLEGR